MLLKSGGRGGGRATKIPLRSGSISVALTVELSTLTSVFFIHITSHPFVVWSCKLHVNILLGNGHPL